jgi:hypothetical protein
MLHLHHKRFSTTPSLKQDLEEVFSFFGECVVLFRSSSMSFLLLKGRTGLLCVRFVVAGAIINCERYRHFLVGLTSSLARQ